MDSSSGDPPDSFPIDSTAPLAGDGETKPAAKPSAPCLDEERYELGDEIGRGGMGSVYRIHDRSLDRRLALKVGLHDDPEAVRRFVVEAKVAARLEHPGVVPIHELGTDEEGRPYFTMKEVAGETLTRKLRERFRTPEQHSLRSLIEVFLAACQTMAFAHSRGVLHRDLKPDNIMVGAYGEVLILDWGLAKVLDAEPEGEADEDAPEVARLQSLQDLKDPKQTAEGSVLGTLAYMAPEQVEGSTGIDARADVYALGGILYEILTARTTLHELGRKQLVQVITAIQSTEPPLPSEVSPEPVPKDLEAICLECLAKDPAQRYAAVDDVIDDLRAWLDDRPVSVRAPSLVERIAKWSRRNQGVVATGGLGLVGLLLTGTAFTYALAQSEGERAWEAERRLNVERASLDATEKRRLALERRANAYTPYREAVELDRRRIPAQHRLALVDRALEIDATFVEAWLERSEVFHDMGRYQSALSDLEQAIRLEPKNARGHFLKGHLLRLHLRKKPEALEAHRRAAEADPSSPFAAAGRAVLLERQDKLKEALKVLDQALKGPGAKGLWELQSTRGMVLGRLGRHEEALKAWKEAVYLAPYKPLPRHNLGVTLDRLGRAKEALAAFDHEIRLRPKSATARRSRGLTLIKLGKDEDALKALHKAVKLGPQDASNHAMLAVALMKRKRPKEALAACDAALKLDPKHAKARMNKGLALRDLGKLKEALAELDAAIALDGTEWKAHFNKGEIFKQLGRYKEMEQAFRAAKHPQALSRLGTLLYVRGRKQEGIALLREAVKQRPNDGDSWSYLGQFLAERNQMVEAEKALRKAGKRPGALRTLARLLWRKGQRKEAMKALRTSLRLKPSSMSGWKYYADFLHKLGRYEEALTALAHLKKRFPRWPASHVAEGRALLALGRYAQSIAAFERALVFGDRRRYLCHLHIGAALQLLGKTEPGKARWKKGLDAGGPVAALAGIVIWGGVKKLDKAKEATAEAVRRYPPYKAQFEKTLRDFETGKRTQ